LRVTIDLVWRQGQIVAKPVKHRGKWRIRWFDENDKRQSEVPGSAADH
jgi:hypothetical protein